VPVPKHFFKIFNNSNLDSKLKVTQIKARLTFKLGDKKTLGRVLNGLQSKLLEPQFLARRDQARSNLANKVSKRAAEIFTSQGVCPHDQHILHHRPCRSQPQNLDEQYLLK
jgi:hypothetical protein